MEKYTSLAEAADKAGDFCTLWHFAGTDETHDLSSLSIITSVHDDENPLDEGDFYVVAQNGAIGQADATSLAIDWLFLPMEVEASSMPASFPAGPTPAFCPNCGQKARQGASFCAGCGNKLT